MVQRYVEKCITVGRNVYITHAVCVGLLAVFVGCAEQISGRALYITALRNLVLQNASHDLDSLPFVTLPHFLSYPYHFSLMLYSVCAQSCYVCGQRG